MSKLFTTGIALAALALLGAGCARSPQGPSAAEESAPSAEITVGAPEPGEAIPEAVIEYRDGKFDPPTLRVIAGTKVTFVNKGQKQVWPASGVHPTHEICPGFDSLKALGQGAIYSFVFEEAKDCPFHNHVAPGEKGKIEVKAVE